MQKPVSEMRLAGGVLLISCYELGHQPMGVAMPLGVLERAGFSADAIDISVETMDVQKVMRARFVGISVPMHTALRLGVNVVERGTIAARHITERFLRSFFHYLNHVQSERE